MVCQFIWINKKFHSGVILILSIISHQAETLAGAISPQMLWGYKIKVVATAIISSTVSCQFWV